MRNKKAISIALSAVMAFTTAFGMTSVKANADEKEKIVVYVAAEGKNASGSAVAVSKTAIQLDEGAVAEDAIKTALDKSAYKDNYKISSSSWGDSLDSIADLDMYNVGNDWYYWGFFVNGQYANLGISSQKVNNNDKISLIYSYNTTIQVHHASMMMLQKILQDIRYIQKKRKKPRMYLHRRFMILHLRVENMYRV